MFFGEAIFTFFGNHFTFFGICLADDLGFFADAMTKNAKNPPVSAAGQVQKMFNQSQTRWSAPFRSRLTYVLS